MHGKHCFVEMSLWTVFTGSLRVGATVFYWWASIGAVTSDFSCAVFDLHAVGCELSFQRRAVPCQASERVQFRIAREMLWFMLFVAQSCGGWSSARGLVSEQAWICPAASLTGLPPGCSERAPCHGCVPCHILWQPGVVTHRTFRPPPPASDLFYRWFWIAVSVSLVMWCRHWCLTAGKEARSVFI